MDFSDNGMSLTTQLQGKKINLDEEAWKNILDLPIIGVRTIIKNKPQLNLCLIHQRYKGHQ